MFVTDSNHQTLARYEKLQNKINLVDSISYKFLKNEVLGQNFLLQEGTFVWATRRMKLYQEIMKIYFSKFPIAFQRLHLHGGPDHYLTL